MRRRRELRPAATATRGTVQVAMRLVIASIPLIPWAARADATLPGDGKKPGNSVPTPTPVEPNIGRPTPPPPGGMPAPHFPEPPRKKK
jgi:hypothetical protein